MIIAVTADYLQDPIACLQKAFPDAEVRSNGTGQILPRDILLSKIVGADAVIAFGRDLIDAEFFDAAGPQLRIVANTAVGVDNIDLAEARRRGIRVTNTPDPVCEPTADAAWLLMLAAARRVTEAQELVRSGSWEGFWPTLLVGRKMLRKTLLVVGAGRIGGAIARRSIGWEMNVLYVANSNKPHLESSPIEARRVALEDGLAQADFVCLSVPLTEETHHLIDARRLGLMKDSAVLVNVARGPVVDEAALVRALEAGRIFAAGLDVFEREPALQDGLAALPNVVLLPHLGSATAEDRNWVIEMATASVIAVLRGQVPENLV